MAQHRVATVDEVRPGERKLVQIEGRSVGIFNVDGTFYALRNVCPHQGAEVCLGSIGGMTVCGNQEDGTLSELRFEKAGEILRCPWHGWEFEIKTGKSIFNPQGCYIKNYPVTIGQKDVADGGILRVETYPTSVEERFVIIHL